MNNNQLQDQLPPLPPTDDGVMPTPSLDPSQVKTPTPPETTPLISPPLTSTPEAPSSESLPNTQAPNTTPVAAKPVLPHAPFDTPVIAPPMPSDIPHEASFPGQPVPEAEQEKLEEKAKVIIASDGGLPPSKATKSKIMQSVLGVLALVLVGAGVFFGQQLVTTDGIGDNRQQASLDDVLAPGNCSDSESTPEGRNACCGLGNDGQPKFLKEGYCYRINPFLSERTVVDCPDWGAFPGKTDGCTMYTNPNTGTSVVCVPVGTNGTSIYCGELRDGTVCAPILGGGGDWCTLIGGGIPDNEATAVSCASLGLKRCHCSNGVWVIGDAPSCDSLCGPGSTNNTCTNCDEPPDEPPDEIHKECVNQSCAFVPGPGNDSCTDDASCLNPSLTCDGLTSGVASPQLGDSVRYTCDGTASPGTINHYNFEYRIGNTAAYSPLAEETVGSGQSAPLLISDPGSYTVRCQACKSTDNTNCSAWHSL